MNNRRYSLFRHLLVLVLCYQFVFPNGVVIADNKTPETTEPISAPPLALVPAEDLTTSPEEEIVKEADSIAAAIADGALSSLDVWQLLRQKSTPLEMPTRMSLNRLDVDALVPGKLFEKVEVKKEGIWSEAGREAGIIFSFASKEFLRYNVKAKSIARFGNWILYFEDAGFISGESVQNVSFIDLEHFEKSLGATEVPVFRIPVKVTKQPDTFVKQNGEIYVDNIPLSHQALEVFAQVQRMAFHQSANLVNPGIHGDAGLLIDSFLEMFHKGTEVAAEDVSIQVENAVGGRENLVRFLGDVHSDLKTRKEIAGAFKNGVDPKKTEAVLAAFGADKEQQQLMHGTLNSMRANIKVQTKLLARFRALLSRTFAPTEDAVPSLVGAMWMVAGGMLRFRFKDVGAGMEAMFERRLIRWGTPTLAASLMVGAQLPETANYVFNGLDVTRQIMWSSLGWAYDFARLGREAFVATVSGFNPSILQGSFLGERFSMLSTGLTAGFLLGGAALGIPHLLINGWKLHQSLRKMRNEGRPEGLSTLFIERQNEVQRLYLEALARAQGKKEGIVTQKFTPEQEKEIRQILETQKELHNSWIVKGVKWVGSCTGLNRFFKKKDQPTKKEITNLSQAIRHFLTSAASFTMSGEAYVRSWQLWFKFRSFVWNQVLFFSLLYYPNFLAVAIKNNRTLTPPTDLNGGMKPAHRYWGPWLKSWFGDETLAVMEAWEEKIIPIEQAIMSAALEKTFAAFVKHVNDPAIFEMMIKKGGANTQISDAIYSLSGEHRRFFYAYFHRVYEGAMHDYLVKVYEQGMADFSVEFDTQDEDFDPQAISNEELKRGLLALPESLTISEGDAASFVENHLTTANLAYAEDQAAHCEDWLENLGNAIYYGNLKKLNPETNRQVQRIMAVERQLKNPVAMARAIRSTMAGLVVDKPLEFILLFVCSAGVLEGPNRLLWDEKFGPDSWFHLGRYSFLYGFMQPLITGFLAEAWSKLQQDERQQDEMGVVPEGEDAKLSFFGWYRKQWNAPNNSIWENQMYNNKLIFANMKAAIITYLVLQGLSLGRLDLDAYIVGYMISYLSFLSGLAMKIEQSFERSTGWFLRNIPTIYHARPDVQEFLDDSIRRKRINFNILYKIYENILGNFVGIFTMMKSSVIGPRAFSRMIFGGYTPTEWAVALFRNTAEAAPMTKPVMNCAEAVIFNNYNDAVRLDELTD